MFCLDARVIYKRETLSVVSLEWSAIIGALINTPDTIVRDRRTTFWQSYRSQNVSIYKIQSTFAWLISAHCESSYCSQKRAVNGRICCDVISLCHFRDYKALMATNLAYRAIATTRPLLFTLILLFQTLPSTAYRSAAVTLSSLPRSHRPNRKWRFYFRSACRETAARMPQVTWPETARLLWRHPALLLLFQLRSARPWISPSTSILLYSIYFG